MGCGGSIARPVQPMAETDMFLKMSADHEKLKLKILLLGTGESGKSTFVKQTKLIAGSKDIAPEMASSVLTLRWNAIESLQILLREAAQQGITYADESLTSSAAAVAALEINLPLDFTEQLARDIYALWMSSEIQRIFARRSEFWLLDTAPYYLNEVVRFASADFEPTEDDFMMTRTRTTGIAVSEVVEKPYKFQIVDVGGQRSERRKWIHCFDDVKAVAYMTALSGYHQGMNWLFPPMRLVYSLYL
jgi:GTPase SAR1 family protein